MNNLTIRQKLFMVFGMLIAIFICNGIYTGYSLSSINDGALRISTEHLSSVLASTDSSRTLTEYRQDEYAIVTATSLPNRIHVSQEVKKLGDQLDITFDAIEPTLNGDVLADFQDMRAVWERYKNNTKQMIDLAKNGKTLEATKLLEDTNDEYAEITSKLSRVVDNRKDFIHAESVAASERYQATKMSLIVCIFAVVLLSAFMALKLSSSIMNSISYLMKVSSEVANGNLTVETKAETNDELGQLTEAYGQTITNLRTLISHIQDTAEQVSEYSAQLTENASQSAMATQQVAESISNVAANTSQQGEAVSASTENIQQMTDRLRGFAEKASSSVEAAHSVEDIATNGRSSIAGAVSQMREIASAVMDSADVIKKLSERSTEIGQISVTISDIAEQTNLLSLNAAIEAARAGEHGRGFAVVAEEVRKLAEQSSTAAQKISELISSIQAETDMAVQRMQKGTAEVESGSQVVTAAGDAFETISQAVSGLSEHAEAIMKDAQVSSADANQLASVMNNINSSSRDVADETQSVSAATEEQSAAMDEVANASRQLSNLAEELTAATNKFKL